MKASIGIGGSAEQEVPASTDMVKRFNTSDKRKKYMQQSTRLALTLLGMLSMRCTELTDIPSGLTLVTLVQHQQ